MHFLRKLLSTQAVLKIRKVVYSQAPPPFPHGNNELTPKLIDDGLKIL